MYIQEKNLWAGALRAGISELAPVRHRSDSALLSSNAIVRKINLYLLSNNLKE